MEHDAYDRLGGIGHPTLVISGRLDQLTPPKFHRTFSRYLAKAGFWLWRVSGMVREMSESPAGVASFVWWPRLGMSWPVRVVTRISR